MVYAEHIIYPGQFDALTTLEFGIKTDSLISAWKYFFFKYKMEDFAVPLVNRAELKESENKDNIYNWLGNWNKMWIKRVTIIPILIGALCTVTKGLVKVQEIWK